MRGHLDHFIMAFYNGSSQVGGFCPLPVFAPHAASWRSQRLKEEEKTRVEKKNGKERMSLVAAGLAADS